MSSLYEFELELIAIDEQVDPRDIVGRRLSFCVRRPDRESSLRWFDGIVCRFAYAGTDDRLIKYRATVVPALWFATKTTDSRIFQDMSVPEIVAEVLRETPGVAFDDSALNASHYSKRDYCVQYQETDYAFICRLLEEEGIYFFFLHERGRHVMVLGDSPSACIDCVELVANQYESSSVADPYDQLLEWHHEFVFTTGRYASTDYNYLQPETPLLRDASAMIDAEVVDVLERFEYPGRYGSIPAGDRRVRVRIEEEEARFETAHGASRCCTWHCGGRFRIGLHPSRSERDRAYMLTSVRHDMHSGGFTTGTSVTPFTYENRFECIPASVVYRPARRTPRPVMPGPQPAIVTGPKGQEIHTDQFGRVKVQFFWDRRGKYDDRSSCWLRSSQPWAGRKWGGIQIPRIGQEVIVDFLDGDPDQPIITGRVYNADSMPPVSGAGRDPKKGEANPKDMVEAAMQMSLRSNSLGGSGGHNEITMHDAGGAEKLFLRAQKDEVHLVQNDRKDTVGHDEVRDVANDRTRSVGNDEKLTVGNDRTKKIDGSEDVTIGRSKTETITIANTQTIGAANTITVGGANTHTVGAAYTLTVGGMSTTTVGLMANEFVGLTKGVTVGDKLEITVGSAKLTMESSGKITLEGTDITLVSSGPMKLESGGLFTINGGGNVDINGPMIDLN